MKQLKSIGDVILALANGETLIQADGKDLEDIMQLKNGKFEFFIKSNKTDDITCQDYIRWFALGYPTYSLGILEERQGPQTKKEWELFVKRNGSSCDNPEDYSFDFWKNLETNKLYGWKE